MVSTKTLKNCLHISRRKSIKYFLLNIFNRILRYKQSVTCAPFDKKFEKKVSLWDGEHFKLRGKFERQSRTECNNTVCSPPAEIHFNHCLEGSPFRLSSHLYRHLFTMLFCSQTPPIMLDTIKLTG